MKSVSLYINNARDVSYRLTERLYLVSKMFTYVDGSTADYQNELLNLLEEQLDALSELSMGLTNQLSDILCAADTCDHSTPKHAVIRRARSRRGSLADAMSETP